MTEYLYFQNISIRDPRYIDLCRLHDRIFIGQNSSIIAVELTKKSNYLIVLAIDSDTVVGYKIGYEDRTGRFYSWLGGVYPEYRNRGIASELMRRQHKWCCNHGYTVIRTQTKNKWRDMLILSLRHGFDVIGTYTDEKGETKIILEKRL